MKDLTPTQQEVLDFITAHFCEHDNMPSLQAIATHFGWKSKSAAGDVLIALERKGQIERTGNGYRFARSGAQGMYVIDFGAGNLSVRVASREGGQQGLLIEKFKEGLTYAPGDLPREEDIDTTRAPFVLSFSTCDSARVVASLLAVVIKRLEDQEKAAALAEREANP